MMKPRPPLREVMKFARAEGIEGEIVVANGVAWIVKGLAHPSDGVIAIPRYSLAGKPRRLSKAEVLRYVNARSRYWSYLSMTVPVVPRTLAKLNPVRELREFTEFLKQFLPRKCFVLPTGSAAIGLEDFRDLDAVIVCRGIDACYYAYKAIKCLRDEGLLRSGAGSLFLDWLNRHRELVDFHAYLQLKLRNPLYGYFKGIPYTLRIVNIEYVPTRVVAHQFKELEVVITRPLSDFTTPCRYVVNASGLGKVVLESYRILLTGLQRGTRIKALFRIEIREDGLTYAIPDHSPYIDIALN